MYTCRYVGLCMRVHTLCTCMHIIYIACMYVYIHACMDGWKDGWMDRRIERMMDGGVIARNI